MTEDQISDVRMFKQILNHNIGRKGKHSLSRILIETRMTEPVLDSLLKSEIYANTKIAASDMAKIQDYTRRYYHIKSFIINNRFENKQRAKRNEGKI